MKKSETKTMIDSDGNPVPMKHVQAYDRLRDRKVRAIHARWVKTRQAVERCMADCIKDMAELQGAKVDSTGSELGVKGNFSVSSFDGLINVQIKQSYRINLDDRARQARDMMLDYAKALVERVGGLDGEALGQIITETFKANAMGSLSVGKVLSLLRLEIRAAAWIKAKELLSASIQPEKGKAYLIVGVKPDRQHDAQTIRLDAADCWPIAEEVSDAN